MLVFIPVVVLFHYCLSMLTDKVERIFIVCFIDQDMNVTTHILQNAIGRMSAICAGMHEPGDAFPGVLICIVKGIRTYEDA